MKELLTHLAFWLNLLNKELISLPVSRKLQRQDDMIKNIKETVDKLFEEMNSKEESTNNEYISREEGEILKSRLDELESVLKDKIDSEQALEDQRNKEINELKQDFDRLRNSTLTMTKKNWIKRFVVSVATWGTDPEKQKRLSYGIKLIENIGRAVGIDMPKISGLLPIGSEHQENAS